MWNSQAIRLMDWATEENNRARAQKIIKVAEKMENRYREENSLPITPVKDIVGRYKQHCEWRKTLRSPKQ